MAIPAFRALGAFASGPTSCTPGLPAGHTTDDILVLIVECAAAETPNTPAEWTSLGSATSGTDVKLTVFIKRHDGSETAPTVDGTSNHVHAWIGAYSGVENTGSPWLLGSFTAQATSTVTYTGLTTEFADALVLLLTAIGDNANDPENLSGYTNANLSDLTDRDDEAETTGTGGGLGFADGGKASAGATGNSTCTHDNAVDAVSVHLALYSSTVSLPPLSAVDPAVYQRRMA